MTLEILICTLNDGINNIKNMLMDQDDSISYLISWQHTDGLRLIPDELKRNDVKIFEIEGRGLSRNRNNALMNASGDICFIADDDIIYNKDNLMKIKQIFEAESSIDLVTFKSESDYYNRTFPSYSFDLQYPPKWYFTASIEVAFRRSSVQGEIEFNELLGLGAPVLKSGEENLFILNALQHNLKCIFYPMIVVRHNGPTTSESSGSEEGVIMARGVIIKAYYPKNYLLRYFVTAYRISKSNNISFVKALKYLFAGSRYANRNQIL